MNRFLLVLNIILLLLVVTIKTGTLGDTFEAVMHANGKINVVIGVIAIIFAGLVIYLMMMDRKLDRIERELKNKQ